MDIKREGVAEAKRKRRIIWGAIVLAVVALVTLGLYRLEPAAPSVDAATVWRDTVKRGEMLRQVRGPGTLVPEEIRRIALNTAATVEKRLDSARRGGGAGHRHPRALESRRSSRRRTTRSLRSPPPKRSTPISRSGSTRSFSNDQAAAARVESEYRQALLQFEADDRLLREGLIPDITQKLSKLRADELENRTRIEAKRRRHHCPIERQAARLGAGAPGTDPRPLRPAPAAARRSAPAPGHLGRAAGRAGGDRPEPARRHRARRGGPAGQAQGRAAHRGDAGARRHRRPEGVDRHPQRLRLGRGRRASTRRCATAP